MKYFCEIILNFRSVVQDAMPFKDISYPGLCWPFCSLQEKHLFIFCREYYEEHCCEVIMNLNQWFRRGRGLKYIA